MPNHPIRLFLIPFLSPRLILIACLFFVVSELNAALVVNAGPDQVVAAGTLVQLDGSASTETDGAIVSYHWYQVRGPLVTLDDSRNAIAGFVVPVNVELEFVLKLVSDSGEVSTDRIMVRTDPYENITPHADAGSDQIVSTGDTVQLNAQASSDADGTIIKYRWYQYRGPLVTIDGAQTATPSFQAPPNAELAFSLTIEDNSGGIAKDGVAVRVEPFTNQAPVANAGVDQTTNAGETVQLDGTVSSDPDGSIVQYYWHQYRGPTVVLQDRRTATPSFEMPANAELAFTLSVTDDSGSVTSDGVSIRSAVNTNQAPVANAGADQTVNAGETVQLDGTVSSDPDGSITQYYWHQYRGPTVVLQDRRTATPSFEMPANAELAFTLSVTDDSGLVTSDGVSIRSAVNTNQASVANAGVDQTINAGETVQLDGTVSSDPDGSIVQYYWHQYRGPTVVLQDRRTATPSFEMPANAELAFTLSVTDDSGLVASDGVSIRSAVNTNQAPVANAGVDQTVNAGETVQLDGTVSSDPDGSITQYYWHQYRGPTVVLQDRRTATPSFEMPANAELAFTLSVTDDAGLVTSDGVSIRSAVNTNQAPVANAGADQIVNAGETVQLDGTVSNDPDGSITQYYWHQYRGPTVALQDRRTATPSFEMPANAELAFTLSVTDDSGLVASDGVSIRSAVNTNQAPVANAGADQTVNAGETVQLDGTVSSDPDGSITQYYWHQYRGPTVVLQDRRTATPSFEMPANAELAFTLSVTDDSGLVTSDGVSIRSTVNTNQAPVANAGADQTVNAGETVQLDGTVSNDPDGSITQYYWHQYRGPTVVLQDRRTATPSFEMPANAELTFTLSVTDNSGSVTSDGILIRSAVNTNQAPVANAGADQTVNTDEAVQLDGSGSADPDGSIVKYTWVQQSGPAIQLNDKNSISPAFTAQASGEIVLRLYVDDDHGSRSFDEVHINIVDSSGSAPVAVAGDDGAGVEGSIFSMDGGQSSAPDGTISSYHWEQVSGPDASVWSGSLESSTVRVMLPIVDQDTSIGFRLTVTDDQGSSSSDELTILVLENLPPEPIPFPEQTVVEGDYYVMDATSLFRTQPGDSIALASYRWNQVSGPPVTLQYKQYREQARIMAPEVEFTTPLVFEVTATDRNGALARNTITLNVIRREDMPENILPRADAGQDSVSISNHYIVVDGSGSVDPDGTIVSYEWAIIDSPPTPGITISPFRGDSRYSTAFTMPVNYADYAVNDVAGDYTIRLTVTDDRGGTSTDEVTVTLSPDVRVGEMPSANAGRDRRTAPYYFDHDDPLSLSSSGSSDGDGTIASIHWQQLTGPKIEISAGRFSPLPIQEYVRYEFLLTVIDDQGNQGDDIMYWSVGYSNTLPMPNFIQPQVVALSGSTLQLDGSGSYDKDDYIASFNWSQVYGGTVEFLDHSSEPMIQLPFVDTVGSVKLGLSVTDLNGSESNIVDDESFWVVNSEYEGGTISAGEDATVFSGDSVELTGEVLIQEQCDPTGGCTNYGRGLRWLQLDGPPLINPTSDGRAFTFVTPQVEERTTVTLALVDEYDAGSFGLVLMAVDPIKVDVLPTTQGLTAIAGVDQQAMENSSISFDGSASLDQDGTIVQYRWEQLEGPDALLIRPYEALTEVYLPAVATESDLVFLLTVVDDTGLEAFDLLRVSVAPDLTDGDIDADGVEDGSDLFPHDSQNAYDVDGDGTGDTRDLDRDGDGVNNALDYYPNDPAVSTAPEITISEPLDGAVINTDYVIVKGTVSASSNIGITINGIVAERGNGPNGSEFAARVPLAEGSNELQVTATTLARKQISQSVTVTREGVQPVKFFVTERYGISPLTNTLSFANSSDSPISQIDIDYEGDGVYDETVDNNVMENIFYQYESEGLYYPQVRFTDSNGMQYTVTQLVNVVSQEQIDIFLRSVWSNMNAALSQGNHGLATDYLFEGTYQKYSEIFFLLLPDFPEIIQSYSTLQLYRVYPSYASYVLNRDIDGIDSAFIISFVRDDAGLWRVSSM